MTPDQAIAMARTWTKDMKDEGISHQMPIWQMVKALLDHIQQQSKDINELTLACQVLLRANKEKDDALQRSQGTR